MTIQRQSADKLQYHSKRNSAQTLNKIDVCIISSVFFSAIDYICLKIEEMYQCISWRRL